MSTTLTVGDRLPEWSLPITPTLVVSTAIATRDFQDVHHDRDRAQAAGSKDIFVNILTSTALCERYVTDWAGPQVQITGIAIRLGAPAYAISATRQWWSPTSAFCTVWPLTMNDGS